MFEGVFRGTGVQDWRFFRGGGVVGWVSVRLDLSLPPYCTRRSFAVSGEISRIVGLARSDRRDRTRNRIQRQHSKTPPPDHPNTTSSPRYFCVHTRAQIKK